MRKSRVLKRNPILPDAKYNSEMVSKFINKVLRRGKKSLAEKIVYSAFAEIEKITKKDPLLVFESAIKNTTPLLEVKSRRIGGATYQVPVEVARNRGISLSMRWLISSAKKRKGESMEEKLALEIIDAANNQGASVKKKEDLHKMAEANKAFAHYRW